MEDRMFQPSRSSPHPCERPGCHLAQAFAIQNYLLAALGANGIMRDGIRALLRDKAADMTLDMRQAVMDALIQAQQDCQLYGKGPNNHLLFDLADTLDLDKCKSEVSVPVSCCCERDMGRHACCNGKRPTPANTLQTTADMLPRQSLLDLASVTMFFGPCLIALTHNTVSGVYVASQG